MVAHNGTPQIPPITLAGLIPHHKPATSTVAADIWKLPRSTRGPSSIVQPRERRNTGFCTLGCIGGTPLDHTPSPEVTIEGQFGWVPPSWTLVARYWKRDDPITPRLGPKGPGPSLLRLGPALVLGHKNPNWQPMMACLPLTSHHLFLARHFLSGHPIRGPQARILSPGLQF